MTSWDAASVIKWAEMAALPKGENGALLPLIRKCFETMDMCETASQLQLLSIAVYVAKEHALR